MKTVRVLVIDDSALMRKLLTEMLSRDPEIQVVGTAMDAYVARDKIKQLNPDVITLDVEMPKMDGLSFLSNLMRLRPMPVVMVSSLTERGAEVTLRAMDLGAVDFVSKSKIDLAHTLVDCTDELIDKVKAASQASIRTLTSTAGRPLQVHRKSSAAGGAGKLRDSYYTTNKVIAIGASTGGTEAIKELLVSMCADSPGIVIAQHIPPVFRNSFAKRMNQCPRLEVCEAEDGQYVRPGHAYIAPGDRHLRLVRDGAQFRCKLDDGPSVNRHKPAVDVLFDSVAESAGHNAIGVILTGMGKDGAQGLLRMREAGALTIAQDENSSVVWGMPRAAVEVGAAGSVLPLDKIASALEKLVEARPLKVSA